MHQAVTPGSEADKIAVHGSCNTCVKFEDARKTPDFIYGIAFRLSLFRGEEHCEFMNPAPHS